MQPWERVRLKEAIVKHKDDGVRQRKFGMLERSGSSMDRLPITAFFIKSCCSRDKAHPASAGFGRHNFGPTRWLPL
jgi:hypothetical protein